MEKNKKVKKSHVETAKECIERQQNNIFALEQQNVMLRFELDCLKKSQPIYANNCLTIALEKVTEALTQVMTTVANQGKRY